MGHTPEQRSQHALCGARRKSGGHCRAFAGQGTDHPGVGRCKFHGGSTPNGKKNAVALEAKQRMLRLGAPIDDAQPHEVLLGLLRASAGYVAHLSAEVAALEDLGTRAAEVLLKLHDSERDRAARIAEACSRAGVDTARIRVEEIKAVQMITAIRAVVDGLELTAGQRGALGPLLRKQAQLLAGETPDPAHDEAALAALASERIPSEWTDAA